MKLFTYTLILLYFYIFSSCKGDSSNSAPFDGVFVTESGIKFELKEDSTTLILFDDTLNYEGVWSIHHTNESEYANIEFAGKPDYYYLKDKKIYRSKRERWKVTGWEQKYNISIDIYNIDAIKKLYFIS